MSLTETVFDDKIMVMKVALNLKRLTAFTDFPKLLTPPPYASIPKTQLVTTEAKPSPPF